MSVLPAPEPLLHSDKHAGFWQRQFQAWLKRRLRPAQCQQLNHRNLFILPTPAGLAYLSMSLVVWLTGTNYDNNWVLALAYLLMAIFVVSILHTFANLAGLEVESLGAAPVSGGETANVSLRLSHRRHSVDNLHIGFRNGAGVHCACHAQVTETVTLPVVTERRGWFRPERVCIESSFPLGLLRCWTWLDLDIRILVYPRPLATPLPPLMSQGETAGELTGQAGDDDFYGFRHWQPGEPPTRIAWKRYARTDELLISQHEQSVVNGCWLDWYALDGLDQETRLSQLCWWTLKLAEAQQPFGLRLPDQQFNLAAAESPHPLLTALALFGMPDTSSTSSMPSFYEHSQSDRAQPSRSTGVGSQVNRRHQP